MLKIFLLYIYIYVSQRYPFFPDHIWINLIITKTGLFCFFNNYKDELHLKILKIDFIGSIFSLHFFL